MGVPFMSFSIGVATITAAIFGLKMKNEYDKINKEWPSKRCSPDVMLKSFFPFLAPKGVNPSQNFRDCMFGVNKGIFDSLMSPFMQLINMINAILKQLTSQIQNMRNMIDSLRNNLEENFKGIMDKLYSTYERIAYLFKTIFNLFNKIFNVFKPLFMILIYSFYTLGNIWNGIPGQSVRWIGNYMCFDQNTLILTYNGYKKIKEIKIGDKLHNNILVLGKYKFDARYTDMYKYKNDIVSGSHLVLENNKWLRVENSVLSEKINKYNNKYIYCLHTSNNIIQTDKAIYTDYHEIGTPIINKLIFYKILYYLNNKTNLKLSTISFKKRKVIDNKYKIYQWCFHPNTKINMQNNKVKKIKDIKIGDITKNGYVKSKIKVLNKDLELYKYNDIILSGTNIIWDKINKIWIPVMFLKDALKINSDINCLYSIDTTSNIITINNLKFRDFEQTSIDIINDDIDEFVENNLN